MRFSYFFFVCVLAFFPFLGFCLRVVSLDLVADQWVLWVLKPEVIVGVSALSKDPQLSYMHHAALKHDHHHNTLEEIILLKPDIVVSEMPLSMKKQSFFAKRGIDVFILPPLDKESDLPLRYKAMRDYFGEAVLPLSVEEIKVPEGMLKALPYLVVEPYGHVATTHHFFHDVLKKWGLKKGKLKNSTAYLAREEMYATLPSFVITSDGEGAFLNKKKTHHKICHVPASYMFSFLPSSMRDLHRLLKGCLDAA